MMERFNFFDVFGYLIPGLALVLLLWLPYGIASHSVPDQKLSDAVISIVIAYILGHFVQGMAGELVSGRTARANGKPAFPSIVVLDYQDGATPEQLRIPHDLKTHIQKNVMDWFKLDLQVGANAWQDKATMNARSAAFYLCRPIVNKTIGYAEQFHGLSAMMSGLSLSFGLAGCYIIGWIVASFSPWPLTIVAWAFLGLSVVAMIVVNAIRVRRGTLMLAEGLALATKGLWAFAVFLLCGGYLLGVREEHATEIGWMLAVVAALCAVASLRFFDSYRYFSTEFGKAIWSYFPAATQAAAQSDKGGNV